ncbi:MAG: FecR domain-containing protein [Burkholderiaceae bacterium]
MRTFQYLMVVLLCAAHMMPAAWGGTAGAPGTVAVSPTGITYYARQGDTLSAIAQTYTENVGNWVRLGALNHISRDVSIPIGTGIVIPAALLADDPTEARVVALSGSVTAADAGDAVALRLGAHVREGTQLQTGPNSFVTLALPDESRVSLPSNSHVRLSKLRTVRYTKAARTEVTLLEGRVESRVAPLDGNGGRYEVRTPGSFAGVRGTHFRVKRLHGAVATEVLGGGVEVGKPGAPAAYQLSDGTGDLIGATVGAPVALLAAPEIETIAPAPQGKATVFLMRRAPRAVAYHVQVARDSDALDLIAESETPGTAVTVGGLAPGEYFARVAAIDPSGLEGMPRVQAFRVGPATARDTAGPLLAAPTVEEGDGHDLLLRWRGDAPEFEIQIARDPAFTWLIAARRTTQHKVRMPRPPFGTYYARVRPIDAAGNPLPFSAAQGFIVTDHWVIHDGNPPLGSSGKHGGQSH